jgi:hypothetical protein
MSVVKGIFTSTNASFNLSNACAAEIIGSIGPGLSRCTAARFSPYCKEKKVCWFSLNLK